MRSDDMQKFGKEILDMARTSFGAWTKNTQSVATEAANYSKSSLEGSAAVCQKLAGAKSLEKATEVQKQYLTSPYEDFVAGASKLSELHLDLAKEAYKPFEAIFGKAPGMK